MLQARRQVVAVCAIPVQQHRVRQRHQNCRLRQPNAQLALHVVDQRMQPALDDYEHMEQGRGSFGAYGILRQGWEP